MEENRMNEMEIVEVNEAEVLNESDYEESRGFEMGNGTAAILGGLVALGVVAGVKKAKKFWDGRKAKSKELKDIEQKEYEEFLAWKANKYEINEEVFNDDNEEN